MQATAHENSKAEVGLAERYWLSSQRYAGTWQDIGREGSLWRTSCDQCDAKFSACISLDGRSFTQVDGLSEPQRSWQSTFVLVGDSILMDLMQEMLPSSLLAFGHR